MDILTTPPLNPFDFYNVKYRDILDFGKRQLAAIWDEEEIDFSKDGEDYEKLSDDAKHLLDNTLSFFFASDGIVFKNLDENFKEEIKLPEAIYTYSIIGTIELIHSRSYGLQLDTVIKDSVKKEKLMNSVVENPEVKMKADWTLSWMDRSTRTFGERLLAFIMVEGVFFSSSFASIYWFKDRYPNLLCGVTGSNDLIARDEALHVEYGKYLFNNYVQNKPTQEQSLKIVSEAVEIEIKFAESSLPNNLLGFSAETMKLHIKSVANMILVDLNLPPIYKEVQKTPFSFMEKLSLLPKKNFFEMRVTEYRRPEKSSSIDFDKEVEF